MPLQIRPTQQQHTTNLLYIKQNLLCTKQKTSKPLNKV